MKRQIGYLGTLLVAFLLLTSFANPLIICAQTLAEPVFTEFGMDVGLSQGSVNALLQDADGFLWIGTHDGLNRFDGLSFKAFKNIQDDSTSLSDDFIRSIASEPGGDLWVGTDRGGLNRFDPRTGRSVRYSLGELGPWARRGHGRTVEGIVRLRDGSLVLSTDRGLALFAGFAGGSVSRIPPPGASSDEAPSASLCALEGGTGLVGFGDGSIWEIGPGGSFSAGFVLPDSVRAIRCPEGGRGFAATREGEVYAFDSGLRNLQLLTRIESGGDAPVQIEDIVRGSEGLLWIATKAGLFLWKEGHEARRVGSGDSGTSLPSAIAQTLLVENNGILWIGTWNGLVRVHPFSQLIRRVPLRRGGDEGLSGNGVVAIEQAGPGLFWVGTLDGGIDLLREGPPEGEVQISREESLQPWRTSQVFGIAREPGGVFWIANRTGGIIRFEPDERRAQSIPVLSRDGSVHEGVEAFSVFVDRSGVVWAGTGHFGLTRYDPAANRFVQFNGPEGEWDLGADWVWPITEDGEGRLWVGTFDGGVLVIDEARGRFSRYEAGPGRLSDNRILTIFADSRGLIWIGTQGGGLNRLDPRTHEVRVFTVRDGLPHDHVEGIIEDDRGFLWVTTNDGLARFDPGTEEFWTLKEAAGLSGNRFHANAVFKNSEGELYFGGENGLTVLSPETITPSGMLPRLALTDLQIHGNPTSLARALGEGGLTLDPSDNFFSFEFAALNSTDPSQNRYRYMLEGLDDDWIDAGPGHLANYTAVRPDRYTFRVQARNADGVWNRNGLSIPVLVRAPFYQTWWFLSLSALAFVFLATGVTYGRVKENRRRLELAARLHDGIGANIASIIRASDRINPYAEVGKRRLAELDRVKSLAHRAQMEMRAAVRILRKGKEGERLDDMLQELRDTVEWMLHDNVQYRLDAPTEVPRKTVDWKVRTDICLLMNEALNNVLKHADASFVEVGVEYRPPYFHLRVKDDGKGFDQTGGSDGNGMGLMVDHATRHGGETLIRSEPGKGTTIEARMKLH